MAEGTGGLAGDGSEVVSLSGDRVSARVAPLEVGLYGAFLIIGALMRFWDLGSRALHHDESLHTTYSWYLYKKLLGLDASSEYHYDPMMHGPYQFHGNALMYTVFGPSVASARLNAAVCGTLLIILPFLLRRQFGRVTALALSGLLAFSPAFLYYSRFTREDIYFALFTAILYIGLIRWVSARGEGKSHRWLFMASAGFALSWSTKESTFFVTLPIILSFLIIVFAAGYAYQFAAPRRGPGAKGARPPDSPIVGALGAFSRANLPAVLGAFRGTPLLTWLGSIALGLFIIVVLYIPIGDPWQWGLIPGNLAPAIGHTQPTTDAAGKTINYSTDAFFGGVQYWLLQQDVARGNQPWYYYFLVIPLYEQVALVFGLAGFVYYSVFPRTRLSDLCGLAFIVILPLSLAGMVMTPGLSRAAHVLMAVPLLISGVALLLSRPRALVINLALWWTAVTWGLYTYAGEKMPWLTLHILLPTFFVAALYLGHLLTAPRFGRRWLITVGLLAVTALLSFRSSVALAYADGANPTEMLIYTQTSQDVPMVSGVVHNIVKAQKTDAHFWVDGSDSWPLVWYLHDVNYGFGGSETDNAGAASGATSAAQQRDAVIILGSENHDKMRDNGKLAVALKGYTGYEFRFRWWFPEEGYRTFEQSGFVGLVGKAVQPSSWGQLANWWATRTPFDQTAFNNWANVYPFFVYVRNDLVGQFGTNTPAWDSARQRATRVSVSGAVVSTTNDVAAALTVPIKAQLNVDASRLARPMTAIRAVAVSRTGSIYLTDSTAQHVVKLDAQGHYVTSWGSPGSGPGQFATQFNSDPMGVAVGLDNTIYVSDTWNHRIQHFSATGAFLGAFGGPNVNNAAGPNTFYGPRQVSVAPNGNIYVADTGNERIKVYSPDGRLLFIIGPQTQGQAVSAQAHPAAFNEPSGVAVDKNGIVYVADYWNKRVMRFRLDGTYLSQYPIGGWGGSQDYGEPYLATDHNGHLFLTDAPTTNNTHINHVLEVDATTGTLIRAYGDATTGSLTAPSGIAVGPDGSLYVADTSHLVKVQVQP